MSNLGNFGTKKPEPEGDTFGWFEHTLRINPSFGELELADFLEVAAVIDAENVSESMGVLKGSLRAAIHEDDFDLFWSTAKRERQGLEDVMAVFMALVEAVADRPTERPSDSSDGPSTVAATSEGGSSSQVIRRLEVEGRPSIALMVQQREASRASA